MSNEKRRSCGVCLVYCVDMYETNMYEHFLDLLTNLPYTYLTNLINLAITRITSRTNSRNLPFFEIHVLKDLSQFCCVLSGGTWSVLVPVSVSECCVCLYAADLGKSVSESVSMPVLMHVFMSTPMCVSTRMICACVRAYMKLDCD